MAGPTEVSPSGATTATGSDGAAIDAAPVDVTYADGGTQVTLVSDSFGGPLTGYRIVDGSDTVDTPTALVTTADDGELLVITGWGPDSHLIRLRDGMDTWEQLGEEPDSPLDQPEDVAATPDGAVLVLNAGSGRITRSTDDGASWTALPPITGAPTPSALSVSATGTLWVADALAGTVAGSTDGGTDWTVVDTATGGFRGPADLTPLSDGSLVVLNDDDASLSVLRAGATTWEKVPASTPGWAHPTAIAGGPHGELYVGDPNSGGLFRSDDGGRTWSSSPGFVNIVDLAVGPDGTVYVTDGINTLLALQPTAAKVTGLTAVPGAAPGEVQVAWDAVAGVDDYTISANWTPTADELAAATATGDHDSADDPVPYTVTRTGGSSAVISGLPTGRELTVVASATNPAGPAPVASTTLTLP